MTRLQSNSLLIALLAMSCKGERADDAPTPPPDPVGAGLAAQTYEDFPDCEHPAVDPDCADGWCKIPAGCFIMGSPEDEWGRGAASEDQVAVTISRAFVIQQHEVTQADWTSRGWENPSTRGANGQGACYRSECPVSSVNWFEAVAYANQLSQEHEPPLEPCYRLSGCEGEPGTGMVCDQAFELEASSAYGCEGYRLPTEAEWEYAARAGTRTAFYTGDITPQANHGECFVEPNLEPIAWYCNKSDGLTHPVTQKRPNGWGLFDMLGNVWEWVHDSQTGSTPAGQLEDPGGTVDDYTTRLLRGGAYYAWGSLLRSASGPIEVGPDSVFLMPGVRLIRTLE